MVLSSVIASLIKKFLSPFVDESTATQLNVFAWSGKVSLANIQIKPNAFDALKLPFRIVHGHIGSIDAQVPWMNIYNGSIVIKIKDVFVMAIPNSEVPYNENDELEFAWAIKKSYLDNVEAAKLRFREEANDKTSQDDGFVMKIMVAAIKNIQIFIENVHICYEDNSTYKERPFQFGVTFEKLFFCNDSVKQSDNVNIISKSVRLENFSIYLNSSDCQRASHLGSTKINEFLQAGLATNKRELHDIEYILCPINFFTNALIHRKPEADNYRLPMIDLDMSLEDFKIQLTNSQISTMLHLLDSIDRIKCSAPYRKWRPKVDIQGNTKEWWKFAFTVITETGIRKMKREFNWENIKKVCNMRKSYEEIYKKKLLNEKYDENLLESYEKQLSLIAIVMARNRAEVDTKFILEQRKTKTKNSGWFSGWFGSSDENKDSNSDNVLSDLKKEFNETERDKMYKAIGYEENSLFQLYPMDFIAHKLIFQIKGFKILIKKDGFDLLHLALEHCTFELSNRPSSNNIILTSKLDKLTMFGINKSILLKSKESTKDYLMFQFEMNPLSKEFDIGLGLVMKSSYILYDIQTIDYLIQIFMPPEDVSLDEIQTYATNKIGDLKTITALGIEYAIEKHKQVKISIDVDPSFVIVPKYGDVIAADTILLLSLGQFVFSSKLIPRANIAKVRDMVKDNKNIMDEMKKHAYENYTLTVKNIQIILSDPKHWEKDLHSLNTTRHLLCPFSILVDLNRCIISNEVRFPKVIASVNIPEIEMKASDGQVSHLMSLLTTLPTPGSLPSANVDSKNHNISLRSQPISNKVTDIADGVRMHSRAINSNKQNVNDLSDALQYVTQAMKQIEVSKKADKKSSDDEMDGKKTIQIHKIVTFDFIIQKICLTVFQELIGCGRSPLANFSLVKLSMFGEMLSNDNLWLNASFSDIRIEDIREIRKNPSGIRTMLEKSRHSRNESKQIFTMYLSQTITERYVSIAMSGFTFIVALDYMLSLIEVATNSFASPDDLKNMRGISAKTLISNKLTASTNESENKIKQNVSSDNKSSGVLMTIDFDLNKVDVIMMESLNITNAEACVFACCSKIAMKLEKDINISGQVMNITMSLANYEKYIEKSEIEASIMAPVDLTINGVIEDSSQLIDMNFGDIYITISPQMISTLLGIFSGLGTTKPENTDEINNSETTPSELFEPQIINRSVWYLNHAAHAKEALDLLANSVKPKLPETNQEIILNMNSIKILIKSGGIKSHPLLRVNQSIFAKIIQNKDIEFNVSMSSDYFNQTFMAWEPLLEAVDDDPFAFTGKMIKNFDDTMKINVETVKKMELLLTNTSINILYDISNAFSSLWFYSKTRTVSKYEENRVVIKNQLGIPFMIYLKRSNIVLISNKNKSTINIYPGESYDFLADDLSRIDLHLCIKFTSKIIVERKITCRRSSVRAYFTSIKTYPVNENWQWLVQVHDTGSSTKEIVLRSNTQIINYFDVPLELYCLSPNSCQKLLTILQPNSTFYLPLNLVYNGDLLHVRPSDDYNLSASPIEWRTINLGENEHQETCLSSICNPGKLSTRNSNYLLIGCKYKKDTDNAFLIKVRGEHFNVLYEDTEQFTNPNAFIYTIKMLPFVKFRNLLPYPVELSYNPMNCLYKLDSGDEVHMSHAVFGTTVMSVTLVDYLNTRWVMKELLPVEGKVEETRYYYFCSENERMLLACAYNVQNSSLIISLYSPYWMVNETGRDVTYYIDAGHMQFKHHSRFNMPLLLCYDSEKVKKKDKFTLRIADSNLSDQIPLNIVPHSLNVLPLDKSKRFSYTVNVKTEMARIGFTKIVTISSFYSVLNISKKTVEFSENSEDWFSIETESSKSFFPTRSDEQSMTFRFSNSNGFQSKYVSLRESSQTLLQIDDSFLFIEIDVTELEAKIKISDYFYGAAPILIVNDLKKNLYYGQRDVSIFSKKKHVKILPPTRSSYFIWIDPMKVRDFVFMLEGYETNEFELYTNCQFDHFEHIKKGNFGYITFFDGKQRVILFTTELNLSDYLLKTEELTNPKITFEITMQGLGVNIVDNIGLKDILYLSIQSNVVWEEKASGSKSFKALSIKENRTLEEMYKNYKLSLQNRDAIRTRSKYAEYEVDFNSMQMFKPRNSTLRHSENRALWLKVGLSEHTRKYHIKIDRIQIDNQLSDHIFDVVFAPVVVPKSVADKFEIQQKSFIEAGVIVQTIGSIKRIKYLQVLIQEFMVRVDWGWIKMLSSIFDLQINKEDSNRLLIEKDLEDIFKNKTSNEIQKFVMKKIYYDLFILGPMKIHLSASMGNLPDGNFPIGLDFFIRFTGATIFEINDTLIKLDYFQRKMVFLGDSELTAQIIDHYKTQFIMQFYKVILGLDIIGNPMKLALGIKKGIGDFFYEPAAGIVQGPEEFAEGIANGIKSLASGVLGGTAGALGRIGTRLGTGVAALTVDDKFQKERRERLNRNSGFAESGKNLFRGFLSGITGVITKPIEGIREEGFEGLFKGLGKGAIGVFVHPATGIIDFTSGSLNAFNTVIDPKQVARPVRPARIMFSSIEIKPYSIKSANDHLYKKK